jgi:hypothetical protein
MTTMTGEEMCLTYDAEKVAQDLAAIGAQFTSGHRDLKRQAHAMAVNVVLKRQWIGQTYKHGDFLQQLVNCHPEWVSEESIEHGLYDYLATANPNDIRQLSHHLLQPCPCMDIQPRFDDVGEKIKARIGEWQREGVIVQALWQEGGLDRWHIEVGAYPDNKVQQA